MTTTNNQGLPTPFHGFEGPNYTQVPDALFDELLAFLQGAELKVLLYIIRRTFGFKRHSDTISLSQLQHGITTREGKVLDHGTGLSKPALLKALRSLQDKQIIFTERRRTLEQGDQPTVYYLNVRDDTPGKQMRPPVVKKVDQGGGQETSPRPWSQNFTTQETGVQETVEQDFDPSNIRKVQPEHGEDETAESHTSERHASADSRGVTSVGDVLSTRAPRAFTRRARPESESEEYQRIQALIADRAREFYDTAPLKSSTTRAWNLFQISGLSIERFEGLIFQARSLTLEATGRITKTVADPVHGVRRKSKMAYFFATLESLADPAKRAETGPADAPAAPRASSEETSHQPVGGRTGHARASSPVSDGTQRDGRSDRRSERDGPYRAWVKS